MKQVDRRESWYSKHTDCSQEPWQRAHDPAAARWQCSTAGVCNLPADIPFLFRHWSADDASPWHQYMLHYRTEYTYRRLGVQCGAHTSDSRPARQSLRDSSARYSADNVAGAQTSTTCQRKQSERAVKSLLGRTAGHRSAPASFVQHTDNSQQRTRLAHDQHMVTITTVSLQLPPRQSVTDHQCFLRCPAIRIHLNTSSSSSSACPQNVVTLQARTLLPTATTTSNQLPRVITECSSCDNTQQQQQTASSTVTMSDSYSTFSGRTMRPVPSNGFSIDDRTM